MLIMIDTADNTIWNYCCDGWLQEIFKTPTIIANFLKKLLATLLLPRVYNKYQLQMQIKNRPLCQYRYFPEIVNLISSIFVIKCINKRLSLYVRSYYIVTTSYQLVFLLWQGRAWLWTWQLWLKSDHDDPRFWFLL